MQADSTWLLLQLEAVIVLLATWGRIQTRQRVSHLETRLFLLEMLATWQLCACSGLLHMMVDVEPKPHFYLTHMYSFHTLHFYLTLAENTCNPAWTLLCILRKGVSVRLGELKIAAQFVGAFLATVLFSGVWAAGIDDSPAQTEDCSNRIQTTFCKAFLTELVVSAAVQLCVMHTQSQEFRVRVSALAATVTALAYAGISNLWAMAAYDTGVSLLVMGGTMVLTAFCRRLARRCTSHELYSFILELSGAFQICACTHELCLLADLSPKPQVALALTYLFTAFHGFSLPSSINNPSSSFQLLFRHRNTLEAWGLQTCAQFLGAALANMYIRSIWTLGTIPAHSKALGENCNSPIQTTLANAFFLELLFSFVFHFTVQKFESMDYKTKVHLLALLVTALVYGGGHLTGAIFNPALAFSLHLRCFLDKFLNYTLVYWVAPCIGSALVAVMWDEVLPYLRRHFNVPV